MADELQLRCPGCARARAFEQPPCPDGHGTDCPERVCVHCGAAVFLGPVLAATLPRRSGSGRRAA